MTSESPQQFYSKSHPSTHLPPKKKKKVTRSREVEMTKLPLYKASPEKRSAARKSSYRESSDSDEDMKSKPKKTTMNAKTKSFLQSQKGDKKMTPEKKQESIRDNIVKMPSRRKQFARSRGDLDLRVDDDDFPIEKCPVSDHCSVNVLEPFSKELQKLFDRVKLMEKEFQEGLVDQSAYIKAKDMFCEWHNAELGLIPEGIEKGYLKDIDFAKIPERLNMAKKRFESIVKGSTKSHFRSNLLTFRKTGEKADDIDLRISNHVSCGYYGWTGTSVIYKHMLDMFTSPNSILTSKAAAPLTITDYIQYVLVPEACLLLIAQDQKWDLDIKSQKEDAIFLMEESEEWGALVHSEILEEQVVGEAFS